MNVLKLAWRQTQRDLAAGEIRLMVMALVLAVMAVTAVGMITDRAEAGLQQEANRLLGGDAALRADTPIADAVSQRAETLGLQYAQTANFPSMVQTAGAVTLSGDAVRKLNVRIGDAVGVGNLQLRYAATLIKEPDAALDYFNVAPKVLIAYADLSASGLVQNGSRIQYRMVVAGDEGAVTQFTAQQGKNLKRGQRLESREDARPEIRSALDRANRFLSLAALVSLILAAVAIALAARRHSARHLDASAVMRCLGASQRRIAALQLGELFFIGVLGASLGVALAWLLQWGVGMWLADAMGVVLPAAGWSPALSGYAVGFTVLIAFAVPPVLALRKVPALRVLRRDVPVNEPSAWTVGLLGIAGLAVLLWWKAGSAELGVIILGGIAGTAIVLAGIAWLLLRWLKQVRGRLHGPWRYGLANLSRHQGMTLTQVSALGLGLMALLLLLFVRTDLLSRWQQTLPADAPNRFVINVQSEQVDGVRAFAKAQLAEREFNLSSAASFGADNQRTAGTYWDADYRGLVQLSVEEEFAETLNWKLGDRIRFDVAGTPLEARITSLRKVEWESFKPNFFVVVSPGALDGFSASYISALHVPKQKLPTIDALVREYPNLSVIDIDAVLNQVRSTVDQVSRVVESVFYFSLLAGLLVLIAAAQASQDERLQEAGVMRVLGASKKQLRLAQATEFGSLGLLAGTVAALAASTIAGLITVQVFNLPWRFETTLLLYGIVGGTLLALVTGLWATRRVTEAPPNETLRTL
ncbi:MAG: FtsX-like permease family protein [Xanthomonadaceae bacterium]|nr:FtsX-like permease family protein [Xanthomonadaceae bacterium]